MVDDVQPPEAPNDRLDHEKQETVTSRDDLLNSLTQITIELGKDDVFKLFALPETTFHQVTSSSSQSVVNDGTGTRPYSASIAFLFFIRAFGQILDGPVMELGGGIGVCGLYLAQYRQHNGLAAASSRVVITDGEPIAVEIAKRNRSFLGLSPQQVDIRPLLWSPDPDEIARQLVGDDNDDRLSSSLEFRIVIGTDLLYYNTDAAVLIATVDTLLAKEGVAFLPGIIRSPTLPDQLVQAASERDLEISTIQLEHFVEECDLESIVSWYNIQFLVVQRKGGVLAEALQNALESAGQRTFDPNGYKSD